MHPTHILKNLSRSHYLYRRAVPGSADKDTYRTNITIYQRLYHSATGSWPDMSHINALIHHYASEFWQNFNHQKTLSQPRVTSTITNSGPGGPNCQAKSADTCRCKSIPMSPLLANALQTVGYTPEEISKLQEITAVAPVPHAHLQEAKKAEDIEKPLTANISVIKFIRRQKRTLYAISLKIEPSVPAVGPLTQ